MLVLCAKLQEQLASLLRTAEELRIKGLAEVSWNDESSDGKRTKPNKSQNSRIPNHLPGLNETAITTHRSHNHSKRHSISNNQTNAEMDPLYDPSNSMSRESDENVAATRAGLAINHHSAFATISPARDDPMPPVKKKRGNLINNFFVTESDVAQFAETMNLFWVFFL